MKLDKALKLVADSQKQWEDNLITTPELERQLKSIEIKYFKEKAVPGAINNLKERILEND